ncbi:MULTISPECIES: hypothetical protein [unclassified Luteimonas]
MRRRAWWIFLAVVCSTIAAAGTLPEAGRHLSFVACPIIRDTELPCWLAEYEDELYFLGLQGDSASSFYSPQFKHKALIEAKVAGGARICGGIPLEAVQVSVMHEIDPSCQTILPTDGFEPPPYQRGPGPAVRPHPPTPRVDPEPPYVSRQYVLELQFDSEFLARRNTRKLEELVRFIELSKPHAVRIEATRGVSRLNNGENLVEPADIAERRATRVRRTLVDLGVSESLLDVHWSTQPLPGNGIDDHTRRRVTITVEVGTSTE